MISRRRLSVVWLYEEMATNCLCCCDCVVLCVDVWGGSMWDVRKAMLFFVIVSCLGLCRCVIIFIKFERVRTAIRTTKLQRATIARLPRCS